MTRDEWLAIEELFHQAAAQPADQREQWVRASCGGDQKIEQAVLQMLAEDGAGDEDIVDKLSDTADNWLERSTPMPTRIGPWRILRPLGSGGMGHVYLASRDDAEYQKLAAVKVLNKGVAAPAVRQRFLLERQILAGLEHPNIARMLDGGTTGDGLPYLVLEYVDGQPLAEYCQPLTLNERCRLFVSVCEAVAYAHQRLIVHRDLKPANILVDKNGAPKLLDFGIAKLLRPDLTSDQTQAVFTADYASPEQLQGKPVTTATDVYALGSILYELVAERPAHNATGGSFSELVSAVCDRDVERPSKFANQPVAQDLDNILLKAMAREPERRYRTAFEFAEDLRRFLADRPVEARGDSWTYVCGKFVRRHRAVVMVVALLLTALAGSAIWSWTAMRDAERQRALANERSTRLRSLTHHLLFDVQASLDGVVGATKARRMLVKTALDHFEQMMKESSGDTELIRDLSVAYQRIGDVQGFPRNPNLEDLAGAVASYRRSLELSKDLPPDRQWQMQRMLTFIHIADTYATWGKQEEAFKAYEDALAAAPPDSGTPAERAIRLFRLAEIMMQRARLRGLQRDKQGAEKDLASAREFLDHGAKVNPESLSIRRARISLHIQDGYTRWRERQWKEAIAEANAAVEKGNALPLEPANSAERHTLMRAYVLRCDVLGDAEYPARDYAAALRDAELGAKYAQQLLDAEPSSARSRYELTLAHTRRATMLMNMGRHAEAQQAAEQCLAQAEELVRVQPGNTSYQSFLGQSYSKLANVLTAAGKHEQSMLQYRKTVTAMWPLVSKIPQDTLPHFVEAMERIGDFEAKRRATAEAARVYRAALDVIKSTGSNGHREFEARVGKKLCRITAPDGPQSLCR